MATVYSVLYHHDAWASARDFKCGGGGKNKMSPKNVLSILRLYWDDNETIIHHEIFFKSQQKRWEGEEGLCSFLIWKPSKKNSSDNQIQC